MKNYGNKFHAHRSLFCGKKESKWRGGRGNVRKEARIGNWEGENESETRAFEPLKKYTQFDSGSTNIHNLFIIQLLFLLYFAAVLQEKI